MGKRKGVGGTCSKKGVVGRGEGGGRGGGGVAEVIRGRRGEEGGSSGLLGVGGKEASFQLWEAVLTFRFEGV